MVTLWLIGTWVAMETCLKPKSIWRKGFQRRDRVAGTICGSATLPMTLFCFLLGVLFGMAGGFSSTRFRAGIKHPHRGPAQQNASSISLVSAQQYLSRPTLLLDNTVTAAKLMSCCCLSPLPESPAPAPSYTCCLLSDRALLSQGRNQAASASSAPRWGDKSPYFVD